MSQESERRLVAFALADEIAALGLNTGPLGGYDGQAEDAPGKPHFVLLSKAALLDGVIKIYSPRAIQIKWQNGKTPERPRQERGRCQGVFAACLRRE